MIMKTKTMNMKRKINMYSIKVFTSNKLVHV